MGEKSTSKLDLVFIHGSGGSGAVWERQAANLAGRHNVLALDLPGHGQASSLPGRRDVFEYAADVEEMLRQHGIKRPVVAGHSLGGAIVLALALRKQHPLRGIVLVGTGARLRVHPEIFARLRADYGDGVVFLTEWALAPEAPPELMAQLIEEELKTPPEVTYGDLVACDGFDVMAQLGQIERPTLIICGTADRLTPVRYAEYLQAHIPRAQLALIEGAGHYVMLEKSGEFNQALEAFLARVAR